jgi:hypothetical protein
VNRLDGRALSKANADRGGAAQLAHAGRKSLKRLKLARHRGRSVRGEQNQGRKPFLWEHQTPAPFL